MRSKLLTVITLAVALAACGGAYAQPSRPASQGDQATLAAEKVRQYVGLQKELAQLFEKKDYPAAAEVCRRMIELAPRAAEPHYNLACALARMGQVEAALGELEKAVELGFTDTAHIESDADLETLRADKRFADLLARVRAKAAEQADRLYEKGDEIAGVKTLEGDPEGGLRYRLRMGPAASKAAPNRLVVWLHPSGGSMNKTVEPMAPLFVKQGYALLVLTAKDWAGWSAADADRLVKRTLPQVGKIEGIDAGRPILFGYSAGGQMALFLWARSPEKFAGLILDAAYPVLPTGEGRTSVLPPPKSEAVKDCPMFVLVGDRDGGSQVWLRCEQAYRNAGVPLTIHYVAGQGHGWLFGGAQRDKLSGWLAQLAAGKTPGAATTQAEPVSTTQDEAPTTTQAEPVPASLPARPIRIDEVY